MMILDILIINSGKNTNIIIIVELQEVIKGNTKIQETS